MEEEVRLGIGSGRRGEFPIRLDMDEIIPNPNVALVKASEVPVLLQRIRPAWQAKDLIERVRRLITVDPSSACQRLFNATVHDLREKIIIAGVDIAREAAKQHKLPPVDKPEDVEDYSTSKLIDLAHRIGLLTRPDWRRLSRCYEIRRDLEHEDDEYEAGVEDCIYIFQTCIVADVKDLIEQPNPAIPAPSLLQDYEHAPQPRQEEILKFLVAIALDTAKAELVRLNAFSFIGHFSAITQNQAKLTIAGFLQEKITRGGPSRTVIRVAYAAGVLPYLKQAHLRDFFVAVCKGLEQAGHHWKKYDLHGDLLRSFKEVGAAPLVEELIKESADVVRENLLSVLRDQEIQRVCYTAHIRRRLDSLADLVDPPTVEKTPGPNPK